MNDTLRIDFGYCYEKKVFNNPFEHDYQFIKFNDENIDYSKTIKILKNWVKEWRGVGKLEICNIEIVGSTNETIKKINAALKNKIVGKIYKFNNND